MKLLHKAFILLSFLPGLIQLEGKTFDYLLDHTSQKMIESSQKSSLFSQEEPLKKGHSPSALRHYRQIIVENVGDQPVLGCFPFINSPKLMTIEQLRGQIKKEAYPLLSLYQLWNKSIVKSDVPNGEHHPLTTLNFRGACSQEDFELQFLKLCQELGIKIRLANVHGKALYDFSCKKGEWNLFDPETEQFYLGLDNKTLIDSETLMDDPFHALRTKHLSRVDEMDFKHGWNHLAHFEILEPASSPQIVFTTEKQKERALGFDLYPHETLTLKTSTQSPEIQDYQCLAIHQMNMEGRPTQSSHAYLSPIPLHKIENCSGVPLFLADQNICLQQNESHVFEEKDLFHFSMTFYEQPKGSLYICGLFAAHAFPVLEEEKNQFHLGSKENPSVIQLHYEVSDDLYEDPSSIPLLNVTNSNASFHYCTPSFMIDCQSPPEKIWWQISADKDFQLIPSNLDQVESFSSCVTLKEIDETFLNSEEPYYFRIKGSIDGQWSDWSPTYAFSVEKPYPIVEPEFDQIAKDTYEINWERFAPATSGSVEYLVFGSNSIDFIPSIYCSKQINAIVNGEVVEEETNDNLVAVITDPKIRIHRNEARAYYRIVAKEKGQLSVPSSIIHLYDQEICLPRNVLQYVREERNQVAAQRTLFPVSTSSFDTLLPHTYPLSDLNNNLPSPTSLMRYAADIQSLNFSNKECPPHIAKEAWEAVRPWLIPDNHPCKSKLDRMAVEERFIMNPRIMKQCGFPRAERVGHWSRVCASSHRDMQNYYFKIYHDCEIYIKYDWKRWIHRCEGAQLIRECIKKHNLQERFKVPRKWIYSWPANGKKLPENTRYVEKNFILVCDNMHICEHKENERHYKKKVDEKWMQGIYIILQECGLYDSVYCFNIPFNKNGCICIIDTEYWHKWPVPFDRLTKCFTKRMKPYWKKLTTSGKIPDGVNSPHNLPRQDRRDH